MAKTSVKEFKLVNVDLIVPYANNARTHSKDQIKKLQSSLSCEAFLDTEATCVKNTHKEIIYRTNNLELALDTYIKAFDEGRTKYND